MTVEIEQSNADNDEPIRGEVKQVMDDGRKGAKVKLESGATG